MPAPAKLNETAGLPDATLLVEMCRVCARYELISDFEVAFGFIKRP